MRNARELLRILAEVIQEGLVPLAVDQARARAADLVREPAGAEDHDPEVLGIGLHRFADGFAQHVAAVAGRRRKHHDVHRKRDHRAGPFVLGLAEQ